VFPAFCTPPCREMFWRLRYFDAVIEAGLRLADP
jgi:hypothetical protein